MQRHAMIDYDQVSVCLCWTRSILPTRFSGRGRGRVQTYIYTGRLGVTGAYG